MREAREFKGFIIERTCLTTFLWVDLSFGFLRSLVKSRGPSDLTSVRGGRRRDFGGIRCV